MTTIEEKLPPKANVEPVVLPRRSRRWDVAAALAVVLFFGLCDLAIVPAMDVISPRDFLAFFVYVTFGAIAAQGGVLAIWSILGSGPIWKRRLAEVVIGSLWLAAWGLGNFFSTPRVSKDVWFAAGVPLLYLALQTPLWIMRILFRWRIERAQSPAGPAAFRPL